MVTCAHGQGVRNPVQGVAGGLPYGGYGVYGNRVLMQANRFSNQAMYRAGVRYFYPRNPYLYQRSRYRHEDYCNDLYNYLQMREFDRNLERFMER
jgi:hypothetical protein